MPAYAKGDRVKAKADIVRGVKTIGKGTPGKIAGDSPADIHFALVKFNADPTVNYRIVTKSELQTA